MSPILSPSVRAMGGGNDELPASFSYCHQITRNQAKNFYYGLKLMPRSKRWAMYAIYAWMRAADDLADGSGDPVEKIDRLEQFRDQTMIAVDPLQPLPSGISDKFDSDYHLIWPAIRQTAVKYSIRIEHLNAMIDGQLLDQRKTRYHNFEELYDYCYKVASVVGLVCITVWGFSGGLKTEKLAEYRGIALQLTNILRDLVEDARRGRVYLPIDEMERFGFSPEGFLHGACTNGLGKRFEELMSYQLMRARHYYELSSSLEAYLNPGCRATSLAMTRIYRSLLEKIASDPCSSLVQTVKLSGVEKLGIALRSMCGRW